MILLRHYFPQIDIEELNDEEFASFSNDAIWLHKQMMMSKVGGVLNSI